MSESRGLDRSADGKGGAGHTVLVALLLAVPVLKVAYTVGAGQEAREAFTAMEPSNWPDVLLGMVLTSPLLGAVLAVVVSRVVFVMFAARGAVPRGGGTAAGARRLALAVVNPLAVGLLAGCFYGLWWGLGTGLAAGALRQGVVVEYRTGRRGGRHHDATYRPPSWLGRLAAAEQWVALMLVVAVLPVLAFASALDGRSWAPVVSCEVTDGTRTSAARLIELGRKGNGVVGWNLDSAQTSNGLGCTAEEGLYVREPWWRSV